MTVGELGFIGLGNIGRPIAENIVGGGHQLRCFDIAGPVPNLPSGASNCQSVAEICRLSDTVLLSLPDGAATLAVVAEVRAATERRVTTVVDLSTVGPDAAQRAAEALRAIDVVYADGPVSGGVSGARAGTLALMYSGPGEVFESHRPVFASFAANAFAVGTEPGQGQAMKLLNNYLSAAALAATSEAVSFGLTQGLEMATMIEVLNASSGRNSATADKFPNHVVSGRFASGFQTRLMAKDMKLFLETAADVGTCSDVAPVVAAIWEAADQALPGSDFTQIWEFVHDAGADIA